MTDLARRLHSIRAGPAAQWRDTVRTAFHEAGHAVALMLEGIPIRAARLDIEGDTAVGQWGDIRCVGGGVTPRGATLTPIVLEAGFVAERIAGVCDRRFADILYSQDRQRAIEIAGPDYRASDVAERAKWLLRAHWNSVLAVTEALLARGELDGEECEHIIVRALPPNTLSKLGLWGLRDRIR